MELNRTTRIHREQLLQDKKYIAYHCFIAEFLTVAFDSFLRFDDGYMKLQYINKHINREIGQLITYNPIHCRQYTFYAHHKLHRITGFIPYMKSNSHVSISLVSKLNLNEAVEDNREKLPHNRHILCRTDPTRIYWILWVFHSIVSTPVSHSAWW